jgi:hypothetical protein
MPARGDKAATGTDARHLAGGGKKTSRRRGVDNFSNFSSIRCLNVPALVGPAAGNAAITNKDG